MPKDVIMGASVVTVLGMSEVCIENYSGITEYTDTLVRIRTKHGQIQLKGSCLEIEFYTNDEMKITGSINLIEFQEEESPMIENGMRYLRGYVKIQIQGYSPERSLNLCSYHHILIWGLAYEDHCYELCMSVRDFKRIRPFLRKKTHTKVRVKEKYGFPFSLYNNRKRKLFFAGFIICIFYCRFIQCLYGIFILRGMRRERMKRCRLFKRERCVCRGC